jgi:anti-anti-sigma factor
VALSEDAPTDPLVNFAISAEMAEDRAVLAVLGEMDSSSTAKLSGFLDAVIAAGYFSVVLDLADCDVDAAGLRAITYAASRLVAAGGELTIRSASARVTRTLDVTWLGELVRLELPDFAHGHLASEQLPTTPGAPLCSQVAAPARGPIAPA